MWVFDILLAGAVILPNPTPSLGQVGAYYFNALNQSQIWIDLEPEKVNTRKLNAGEPLCYEMGTCL